MSDIILSAQNGQAVVSSLDIAEKFEKRHDHVMRDIEDIMKGLPKMGTPPCSSRQSMSTRRMDKLTPCT